MTHMLIWSVYNMKADFRWFFFFFASDKGKMKMFGFEVMEKKESFEKLNKHVAKRLPSELKNKIFRYRAKSRQVLLMFVEIIITVKDDCFTFKSET